MKNPRLLKITSLASKVLWFFYVGLGLIVSMSLFAAIDNIRSTGEIFDRMTIYVIAMPVLGAAILALQYYRSRVVKELVDTLVILLAVYGFAIFFYISLARRLRF